MKSTATADSTIAVLACSNSKVPTDCRSWPDPHDGPCPTAPCSRTCPDTVPQRPKSRLSGTAPLDTARRRPFVSNMLIGHVLALCVAH